MALIQFLWLSYDTYGLKERILYTQQNGSFVGDIYEILERWHFI